MKYIKHILTTVALSLAFCFVLESCSKTVFDSVYGSDGPAIIYPDYKEVTIPSNIAPLNFYYAMDDVVSASTSFSIGERTVTKNGIEVKWGLAQWKKFLSDAAGMSINVKAEIKTSEGVIEDSWNIFVSEDTIDPFLTYRLIEPSYQMWNEVEIVERNIETFDETVICDHLHTDNSCMNCHIHVRQRGDLSMFYIRGPKGGAILNEGGKLRKLELRTDGMVSGTVYGEIHPEGRFGVFSTNVVIPGLHSFPGKRMEVYDTASDLSVVDFEDNKMINHPHLNREDKLETFPCFSADGNSVFYCVADTLSLPEKIYDLKYSLVRSSFNPETGMVSEQVDTVWSGPAHNASVCHPKASPDGRWIMFTVASYGTFPINHNESELHLIDLISGEEVSLNSIKGDHSDTYHSWSSNGRWFVFASKRGDGQYGKPYFCHLDSDGNPGRPFVLPQRSPRFYENFLKSFNIPDIGSASTGMNVRKTQKIYNSGKEVLN